MFMRPRRCNRTTRARPVSHTPLNVRDVRQADTCAICQHGLGQPEPASDFPHARTEHEA